MEGTFFIWKSKVARKLYMHTCCDSKVISFGFIKYVGTRHAFATCLRWTIVYTKKRKLIYFPCQQKRKAYFMNCKTCLASKCFYLKATD